MYHWTLKSLDTGFVWLVMILEVTLMQSCYPSHQSVFQLQVQYTALHWRFFSGEPASKITPPPPTRCARSPTLKSACMAEGHSNTKGFQRCGPI